MTPVLSTDRLVLRGWRDEDLDPLAALDADPEVMKFIGDGRPRPREQAARTLRRLREMWNDQGFGLFAVAWRADVTEAGAEPGAFVGWVGLAVPTFLPEILPAVEIGWRLRREWWGRGLATEAARAVLRFGFEEINLDRIVSVCHVDNHASENVMRKLGMTRDRETTVPAHGQPIRVLAITADEYQARQTAAV